MRRWSAEGFGGARLPVPPEVEAEMLQIVYLATDAVRISGSESERSVDYLWLLATAIAGDHAALKDVLTGLFYKDVRQASVLERITRVKAALDEAAVLADGSLISRWSGARDELRDLAARTDVLAAKSAHEYGEYLELELLRDKRADVVKSLMKIADSIQLVAPTLVDLLTAPVLPSLQPQASDHLRALDPAKLRDRNHTHAEETKAIARQELDRLRYLTRRMAEISRKSFADSAQDAEERLRVRRKLARKTTDGVEIGKIPTDDLHAKLRGCLQKVALSMRDFRSKVDVARKRLYKSDIQHALGIVADKTKRAVEALDAAGPDTIDASLAPAAADRLFASLRDIMTAQTSLNTRVNIAKLSPAEKQPLCAVMYTIKMKLGDDIRDLELVRAELADRVQESVAEA